MRKQGRKVIIGLCILGHLTQDSILNIVEFRETTLQGVRKLDVPLDGFLRVLENTFNFDVRLILLFHDP